MSSAIKTPAFQAKAGNIQNEDGSSIYSGGEWSFKNASAVTGFHVASDGKVGVGTTSPSYKLDVQGGGARIYNSGAADNSAITYSNGSKNWYVGLRGDTGNVFAIADDSAFRMVIDADGNLLVGTSSTQASPLSFAVNGTFSSGIVVGSATRSALHSDRIGFNASQFYVLNPSSVGVILPSGATSWQAQSDERSKKNIKPLELGLEQIKALKPARFDYNNDESEASARVGFIAQEVLPVLPHAVSVPEDSEQMMGVSATEMIPVLVKAIQELSAQVEELKAKLP